MLRKAITGICVVAIVAGFAFGQEPTPTPTPARSAAQLQMDQLQEQIDLLKKQQEYEKAKSDLSNQRLKEIMNAAKPLTDIKGNDSKTTFTPATTASAETASLSYKALAELSSQIEPLMHPFIQQYTGIVIYNEPDFLGLAKYRVYRTQSDSALGNYKAWRKRLEDFAREQSKNNVGTEAGPKRRGIALLPTILSAPNIAAGFAGSVGELLSLFRTETFITEGTNTVDAGTLGTAIAKELWKGKQDLKIFYPGAFVPEYDLESEGKDSILIRVTDINMAYADVSGFLSRCKDIPPAERNKPPLRDIIDEAEDVNSQLRWLAVGGEKVGGQNTRSASESDDQRTSISDLRQLVRGEKLDRFMRQGSPTLGSATGPKVGILKLRSLASGGSRRETRNLFRGDHISYSGSVTLEVLLFDVDGTLRYSEIFSSHTGFRKLKTTDK